MLKDFQSALKSNSRFNGYGSYNLGFMLYGLPGTGKTTFIKAICNYLNRNAFIIDMRQVKTNETFRNLFSEESVKSKVFVLEEFDCVQGIFDRTINAVDNTTNQKSEFERRKLELLKVLASSTNDTKKDIEAEVKKLTDEISNLENKLTIDNILTILDGPQEMRGRVMIATTNMIDKIDPALLREGRFDLKIKLENLNCEEIRELLLKMFENNITKQEEILINKTHFREDEFSPVKIINVCHKYQTVNEIVEILKKPIDPNGTNEKEEEKISTRKKYR